jgi:hypothetical protein
MSLLFSLPSNLLSYIYSFDATYRELMKNLRFRFEILLQSRAAENLINQYIQEMFDYNMIWHNNYGTFGLANRERVKSLSFYSQYKLFILHETRINYIYFKIQPLHANENADDIERYDGFLTIQEELEDDTYIRVERYQYGGRLYLFVDDI